MEDGYENFLKETEDDIKETGHTIQIKLRRMQELFFNAKFFISHGGTSAKHVISDKKTIVLDKLR